MRISIPDTQTTPVTVTASPAADASGNPGVFNGPLSYSNSNTAIIKTTPSADSLSVDVEHIGAGLGEAVITATDGIVSASFTVDVVATEAKDIVFAVAPVAAPAAPAPAAA